MRAFGVSLLFSLLLLPLLGCREKSAVASDVLAEIEGEGIAHTRFEIYLRDNVDSSDLPLEDRVLDQLFDQFLDELLLIRLALDRGLEAPPVHGRLEEGAATLANPGIDQRQAVEFLLQEAELQAPGEAEIRAYYESHRELYQRPASIRLEQILVDEREVAEEAERALFAGEDFAQVAARFSQVPLAGLGDPEGRLSHEDLPPVFADEVFALEPGEVSGIINADYGFHLFRVVERQAAREIPLIEVVHEIRAQLIRSDVDEVVASLLEQARGRYDVRVYPANFPFEYRGLYAQNSRLP